MPRINVENKWWFDSRRSKLGIKLGSMDMADGVALRFWRLAIDHAMSGSIPAEVFDTQEYAKEMIEVGLAERRDDAVYIRGSDDCFEWYVTGINQRSEAGKRRANTAKRDSKGRLLPRQECNENIQRPSSDYPAVTSGHQPSSSSSSSKNNTNTYAQTTFAQSPEDLLKQSGNTTKGVLKGSSRFDLESLYQGYPRKVGKGKGISKLRSMLTKQEDYDSVGIAIRNYASYCKTHGIEPRFIKHFSTFVNEWRDWLDPDPSVMTPKITKGLPTTLRKVEFV